MTKVSIPFIYLITSEQVRSISAEPDDNVDPTWIPDPTDVSNISITEEPAFNVTEHRGDCSQSYVC